MIPHDSLPINRCQRPGEYREIGKHTSVTTIRIGVDSILRRIITTFESTERSINCIEPVVKRGALNEIPSLQQGNVLRADKGHGILKIKVRFSIEIEALILRLDYTTVDRNQLRT